MADQTVADDACADNDTLGGGGKVAHEGSSGWRVVGNGQAARPPARCYTSGGPSNRLAGRMNERRQVDGDISLVYHGYNKPARQRRQPDREFP